jgi:hypothetical protein
MFVNKNTEMDERLNELNVDSTLAIRLAVALIESLATDEKISNKTLKAVHKDADKMIAECKALGYN